MTRVTNDRDESEPAPGCPGAGFVNCFVGDDAGATGARAGSADPAVGVSEDGQRIRRVAAVVAHEGAQD